MSDSVLSYGLLSTRLLAHGILQARILEWAAIPFSKGSSQPSDGNYISCVSFIGGEFFTPEPLGRPVIAYVSKKFKHH